MPGLAALLRDTMFGAACGGRDLVGELTYLAIDQDAADPPKPADSGKPETTPIWSWAFKADTLSRITGAKVRSRQEMGGDRYAMMMPVCERVDFGLESGADRAVFIDYEKSNVALPLAKKFLLGQCTFASGTLDGKHELWPLASSLDRSMMLVFGYGLESGEPKQLMLDDVKADDFMPPPGGGGGGGGGSSASAGSGDTATATVRTKRVLVCVCFMTRQEKNDFDPGGLLGQARLYPITMVMANFAVTRVETAVTIQRPEKTPHAGDDMLPEIRPILFTDSNDSHLLGGPLPIWDNFFDYYDVEPLIGREYKFVDSDKYKERTEDNLIKRLTTLTNATSIRKVSFQGEYDNLHLAPRMKADRAILAKYDLDKEYDGWSFDKITMAPYCVHDCLHMHTRWSEEFGDKPWTLGFDHYKPYKRKGAPMVPYNQDVWIKLESASRFRYRARAGGTDGENKIDGKATIEPGRWQIFFHHGAGYAVDFWPGGAASVKDFGARLGLTFWSQGSKDPRMNKLTTDVGLELFKTPWWLLYWLLRYDVPSAVTIPVQRLQINDRDRARAL